jgi:hypothetical protein
MAYHATRSWKVSKSKFASHALKTLPAKRLSDCLPTALEAVTCKLFFSRPASASRPRKIVRQILRARAGGKLYPREKLLDHARAEYQLKKLSGLQRFHACPN